MYDVDPAGSLTTKRRLTSTPRNGNTDEQYVTIATTYDPVVGLVSNVTSTTDSPFDGTIDENNVTTYAYDANGLLTQEVVTDYDGNNVKQESQTFTLTYDGSGNLATSSGSRRRGRRWPDRRHYSSDTLTSASASNALIACIEAAQDLESH